MKRNQALIAVGIIILLILGGVWYWQKNIKEQVITEQKTFEKVEGEEGWVWFPVPELGIEIKVKDDIAPELVYRVETDQKKEGIAIAQFTTQKLLNIGKSGGIGEYTSNGNYNCHIGFFARYDMSEEQYLAMQEAVFGEGNVTPVSIDGYFIRYTSPQASCAWDRGSIEDERYEQYLVSNWWESDFSDLKAALQNAVRRMQK